MGAGARPLLGNAEGAVRRSARPTVLLTFVTAWEAFGDIAGITLYALESLAVSASAFSAVAYYHEVAI
jgi:hypothetical protein